MDYIYLFPIALALLALSARSLDFKGALVAMIMGLAVLKSQDLYWLSLLLVFFVVGTMATKIKAEHKKQYGLYQKIRSTENVIGNGGMALLMALIGNFYGFAGALSTATADTLSSELGILSKKKPRLITSFKRVKTGTDGAISALGTAAEIGGALIICIFILVFNYYGAFTGLDIWKVLAITFFSGLFGCTVDSLLGATIERRGIFDNAKTNFVATLSGAAFAILLSTVL